MMGAVSRDDDQLLDAWRGGDRRAGSELFSRHFDELYGFFRHKVETGEDAEDLVQQSMLACVSNRDGFRGDASFRTYLFRVARSRLIDWYRKRGRQPTPEAISSLVDPGRSPSSWFRDDERKRILIEALSRLSFDHQSALELHYVRGFKTAELADILGIPHPTARSRLNRARANLIEQIEVLSESGLAGLDIEADLESWAGAVHEAAGVRGLRGIVHTKG